MHKGKAAKHGRIIAQVFCAGKKKFCAALLVILPAFRYNTGEETPMKKTVRAEKMDRADRAVQLKHGGCNCCQAVLCAFAEETGMTADELMRIGAAFGGGMGCLEGTCGALLGAQILLGIKKYGGRPVGRDAANVLRQFKALCGATVCKDLKGVDTGVVLCPCDDCVRNAVKIAEGLE